MGSIALPVLHLNPPPQPANPVEQYGQILQLRNAMQEAPLRQQALQQQVQLGQQQIQTGQQAFDARQALNDAYAGAITTDESGTPTIDPGKLAAGLKNGPAAYQTPEVLKGVADFHESLTKAKTAYVDLQTKQNDVLGSAAAAVKAANYDPAMAHSLLDSMPPSPQLNAIRAQIDNPAVLKQFVDTAIQNSSKQRELGAAETTAAARQQTAQTEAQKYKAQSDPTSPFYAPTAQSVALGTAPGAAAIQAGEVAQAGRKSAAEMAAKQPYEIALNKQKQALSQGDPEAAADLLISGEATLSELKARGATPDFIVQTLTKASQKSNGQYNAPAAEAQYSVAHSPEMAQFFGASKSLTNKNGSLDKLTAAGAKIPGNQIPAFNSLADWEKAKLGSGPLAQYAAAVLGVADDYAKVMGGGAGSDTSRAQALNLIQANASPEARAAAIQGIRDATQSQIDSRTGDNPVLGRMYGTKGSTGNSGGAASGGKIIVTDPSGKQHPFDTQAQADHFKQLAGIK